MTKHTSLYKLNHQLKKHITNHFTQTVWLTAEISQLSENPNGHCYLELIEKSEKTDNIIAQARATIWAYTYRMLKPFFRTSTNQTLKSGLKILVKVYIEFDEKYGYTLNVRDIDPTYTLGDIAQKRQQIIEQLQEEGIIDMNKQLLSPLVPQKIAIISSPTAAGYEDFINQLDNNPHQFKFYHKLFPATMQGEKAENSIIQALDQIHQYENFFDLVVLVRGGGSQTDLSCFDSYPLAQNIAQYPLPIITGIGHERDDTIADIVAHKRLKTPTAVAQHLINSLHQVEQHINDLQNRIISHTQDHINHLQQHLNQTIAHFVPAVETVLTHQTQQLATYTHNLRHYTQSLLTNQQYQLHLLQNKNDYLNPINILKKGYSLTSLNGKILRNTTALRQGDKLQTTLAKGKIESKITHIKNKGFAENNSS